ncbi:MAG: hypothetical protein ACRDPY_20390 [Streptosporangiaceae bacterium]
MRERLRLVLTARRLGGSANHHYIVPHPADKMAPPRGRPGGALQFPREMTRRLCIRNRVELREKPDHIGVWPDQATDQEPSG